MEAERFKASIIPPKGNINFTDAELKKLRDEDSNDDNFFHITCHVDPGLKEKIEQGEFVDLDILLPKERCGGSHVYREEKRLELVQRDGQQYYAPVQTQRINSVRKWEQTFRIYAVIYTQVNPNRAGEIWQYIYCINTAALTFQWDNVVYYDFTFRQLMAVKPWCSWAKTYTQGWNLAMREGVVKNQFQSQGSGGNSSGTANTQRSTGNSGRDWKDHCCWCYNCNRCKSSSSLCKYNHRCTYCGGWSHGYYNCNKRTKKSSHQTPPTSGGRGSSPGAKKVAQK